MHRVLVILFFGTMTSIHSMQLNKSVAKLRHYSRNSKQFFSTGNKPLEYGRTPLHLAKSIEEAKLLIKNGAHVNAQDKYGNTPLHIVPAHLVPLLVSHGADVTIKNNQIIKVTSNQDPSPWHLPRSCWERVPYWYAKEFWKLVHEDKQNMGVDYIGHYSHLKIDIYCGLTAPMDAVLDGNFAKVMEFQKAVPMEIIKQIKSLKLIALRKDFEKMLESGFQTNKFTVMYNKLCEFEKEHKELD